MKERPIIFSGPMVRAILAGTKTQARRVVKPQPPGWCTSAGISALTPCLHWEFRGFRPWQGSASKFIPCPYLPASETRLWVRETWLHGDAWYPDATWKNCHVSGRGYTWVDYRADATREQLQEISESGESWRPSIHMPRWASRITLEIIGIRAERLQDISEEDAMAEGVGPGFVPCPHREFGGLQTTRCVGYRPMFRRFWDSINLKKYPWYSNPWVWVVEFRRVNA